jgi:hypothetical protein
MSTKASVIAAIEASLREAQGLPGWPAPTIDNAKVTPDVLPHGGGVVTISADVTNADTITLTDFTGTEIATGATFDRRQHAVDASRLGTGRVGERRPRGDCG